MKLNSRQVTITAAYQLPHAFNLIIYEVARTTIDYYLASCLSPSVSKSITDKHKQTATEKKWLKNRKWCRFGNGLMTRRKFNWILSLGI